MCCPISGNDFEGARVPIQLGLMSGGAATVKGNSIREFQETDGVLRVGGAAYLHLTATGPGSTTFNLGADPDEVDLALVIFRIR